MSRNPRCNSGRALPGRRPLTLALSAVLAQGLWLPSLQAQSGDEETARLDEVTVTATRRAESVQDVPLNI
ncbi:MAG: hypothetical protein KDI37_01850, partial [Xanthomonadales bacterium]|nr:hypothetical protein [Xanthomonadales bacterium]